MHVASLILKVTKRIFKPIQMEKHCAMRGTTGKQRTIFALPKKNRVLIFNPNFSNEILQWQTNIKKMFYPKSV